MGRSKENRPHEEYFMGFYLQALHQGWKRVLSFCWSLKCKPIDYDALFERKVFNVALLSNEDTLVKKELIYKEINSKESKDTSVGPTVVEKVSNTATNRIYISVHK